MFVTVWLGILEISTGELISACAGHEYPVFWWKNSGFVMERDPHGLAMGAMEGTKYRTANWHLDPGDMLFLYTDGVPEANNSRQELFGDKRMLAALEKSRKIASENRESEGTDLKLFLNTLRSQIDDFAGETPQFDDITMMCVEFRGSETKAEADKM